MRLSARGAQKTRDESKKLQMYSKQWLPGDTLRVFYPIYWEDGKPEIAVGALWGHSVSDIKGLGLRTAFIPSTTNFDENAQPIGQPDITYQFSQIARIFVNGAKTREEAQIMAKQYPNDSIRKEALKNLEAKYDTKNNQKAVKPIISKPQYYISTEVLSVKIVNNVPNDETIEVTSAPLSSKTIRNLYALMDNPKYAPQEGDRFFEVEWHYIMDQEKSKSARDSSPAGLTPEYKMPVQFPATYSKIESRFDSVATDSESIVRRATTSVDPNKVRSHLQQWAFMHSEDLDSINEEDTESLVKNIQVIKELDLQRALVNPVLVDTVTAAITELEEAQRVEGGAPQIEPTPDAGTSTEAPIPNLMESIPGAPNIDSLLNNDNIVQEADVDLETIDLGQTV